MSPKSLITNLTSLVLYKLDDVLAYAHLNITLAQMFYRKPYMSSFIYDRVASRYFLFSKDL